MSTHKGQVPRRKDRSALDAIELNHLCRRMEDLGATREQTDTVRRVWPSASPDERASLLATCDTTLEGAIAEANAADAYHEVDTPPEDPAHAALMAEVAPLVETQSARQLLNDWVKGDPAKASALLDVERAGRNRTSLVRVLEELARA